MDRIVRTVRGAVGVGVTWAAMWAVVGLLIGVGMRLARPQDLGPGEHPITIAVVFGVVGLLSGAIFAIVMAIAERRRTLGELSVPRAAGWGALASVLLPLLTSMDNGMIVIFAPLGAMVAATSVALAKRHARRELAAGDWRALDP